MFRIQGTPGKDLCDEHLRVSRRDVLRVGGSGLLGLSLGNMLKLQAHANEAQVISAPGWGKAKSVIMVYLQGGPSHLDLWDPKENVPENVKSPFSNISTKIPGIQFTENLPKLAQINDRFSMIRSMSYTPNGLFNHTAAIYQWPSDKMDELIQPVSAMTALLNIDPKVTSLGGGLPITINKQIVGGLGISGGALSQDIEIAQYVLKTCCGQ